MKKIICLLLATVMMFSLVACGNDKPETKPENKPSASQPGEGSTTETPDATTPDASQPGTPDPAPDVNWVIKEGVKAPGAEAPKKVVHQVPFIQGDAFVDVNLYHPSYGDMKPEDVMAALQQMPQFEGWTWNLKQEEKGYGKLYTDIGYMRGYEYSLTIIADKPVEGHEYVSDTIRITFGSDTSEYDGWRSISISYSTPANDVTTETQAFIKPVVQEVFGDAAEYMLYAPVTEERYNEMTLDFKNELGSETLKRKVDDNDVWFSVYAYSKLDNKVEEYPGDYMPMMRGEQPLYIDKYFPAFGNWNYNNVKTVNSPFFGKWFPKYDYTTPDSYDKMYTYSITTYENGDQDVDFQTELMLYQKGDSWIEGVSFELNYSVEVRDGVASLKRASMYVPAFAEDWDNNDNEDPTVIKRMSENLKYAMKVANAVFDTKFDFEGVYWNSPGDYFLYSRNNKATIGGEEKTLTFEFSTKTIDSIGKNRSGVRISIS